MCGSRMVFGEEVRESHGNCREDVSGGIEMNGKYKWVKMIGCGCVEAEWLLEKEWGE